MTFQPFSFNFSVMLQTTLVLQSSNLVSLQGACHKDTAPPPASLLTCNFSSYLRSPASPLEYKFPEGRGRILLCISATAPIPLPGLPQLGTHCPQADGNLPPMAYKLAPSPLPNFPAPSHTAPSRPLHLITQFLNLRAFAHTISSDALQVLYYSPST